MAASVFGVGTVVGSSSATTLSVPAPGGVLTGHLMLYVLTTNNDAATITTSPGDCTRLDTGTDSLAVFARIGTASEANRDFAWSAGACLAQCIALESDDPWVVPLSTIVAAQSFGTPSNGADIQYPQHTANGAGRIIFRLGMKRGATTGITLSSVTVDTGYLSAGFAGRSNVSGGLILTGEVKTAVTTAAQNLALFNAVISAPWSSNQYRRGLTLELKVAALSMTTDKAIYYPGETIVATGTSAFVGTLTVTIDGVAIPSGSVSGSGATRNIVTHGNDAFDLAGVHAGTNLDTTVVVSIQDDNGTYTANIKFRPQNEDAWDLLAGGSYDYAPVGAADNDTCWVDIQSGAGEPLPRIAGFAGGTVPSVVKFRVFDDSAGSWFAHVNPGIFDVSGALLDGEFADAFQGGGTTSIESHIPDGSDVVGGGWLFQRDVSSAPLPVSGTAVVVSDQFQILADNCGGTADVGTVNPNISVLWDVEATDSRWSIHVRRVSDAEHIHVFIRKDGVMTINQRVGGVNVGMGGVVSYTGPAFTDGQTPTIRVDVVTTAVKVYVDEVLVLDAISNIPANISGRYIGIYSGALAYVPVKFNSVNVRSDYVASVRTILTDAPSYAVNVGADTYLKATVAGKRFDNPISSAKIYDIDTPIKASNYVENSNLFSSANWSKEGTTVLAAQHTATLSDGTSLAMHKLSETAVTANHQLSYAFTVYGGSWQFCAIKVKAVEVTTVDLYCRLDDNANTVTTRFNLSTGAITSGPTVAGTATANGAGITNLGDSVYLIWQIFKSVGKSSGAFWRMSMVSAGSLSYLGNVANGVYCAQAQFGYGVEVPRYTNTTTFGVAGLGQRLLHAEDISESAFNRSAATVSGTTHSATLATGEVVVMQKLLDAATTAEHFIFQDSDQLANQSHGGSVLVKLADAERPHVLVGITETTSGFNSVLGQVALATGVVSSVSSTGNGSGAVVTSEDLGGGVYRVSVKGIPTSGSGNARLFLKMVNDSVQSSYLGDITKGVYIKEPVIHSGTVIPPYVPSAQVRLDAGGSARDYAEVLTPQIEDLTFGGKYQSLDLNSNVALRISDGANFGLANIQATPPVPANYGIVGPGPFPRTPIGGSPGHKCYIHVISGTGVAVPASYDFIATTPTSLWILNYDTENEVWTPRLEIPDLLFTGGVASALADIAMAAAGTVETSSGLVVTLDPVVLAAVGSVDISGTINKTLDPVIMVAVGGRATSGTLATTLQGATLSMFGALAELNSAIWPVSLPQTFEIDGYSEDRSSGLIRTQMDSGPVYVRRRFTTVSKTLSGNMMMSSDQVDTLFAFFDNVLGSGAAYFNFIHPRTGNVGLFRFVDTPSVSQAGLGGDLYNVEISLELKNV